ncbi:hypothetical protein GOBAR_AA30017 [Gossypium barbadense]|uniref:Dof zinc finger protein n=1 Tax=Gossypium barbadense TaxID=3634 RepID=A0A2P5WHW0_GOSBA|nr:hypothetical protein GOBAR_AA30017 [Gossypium barbadense]
MEATQWEEGIGVTKPMAIGGYSRSSGRVQKGSEANLNCPRCNSTNTKFCYYNNYSLSQPRYFCKTCRRYWTHGGSLRNVPVGGGSRKNKTSSSKKLDDDHLTHQNPKIHEGDHHQVINLAYPPVVPAEAYNSSQRLPFMPEIGDANTGIYSSGFPVLDPGLKFSSDGFGTGYDENHQVVEENGERLLFPVMEESKQVPMNTMNELEEDKEQGESTGHW